MNILHIYDEYGPVMGDGSAPTDVIELSRNMSKMGHDVTVIERMHKKTDPLFECVDGVNFVRLKAKKRVSYPLRALNDLPFGPLYFVIDGVEFAMKVNRYIKTSGKNFDIFHVHFPFATNVLITMNRKIRRRTIYTAHLGEEKSRLRLDIEKEMPLLLRLFSPDLYLMNRVRKVVVLNEPLRSKLIGGKIKPENITAIPNGVNTSEFNPTINVGDIKEKYELNNKTTILFAGSITPRKGVEYIVKAANIIINQFGYDDVRFLIAGSPSYDKEYAEKISRLIEDCALEESVQLTGLLSQHGELKSLYVACDIFILPSKEEGHGLVLTEAMASGKPLIGTNVGGIPVQIRDGWNGFLVEPANEKQLAEKIKYLIDHPEKREEMGRNSRKLAEEVFDWRTIAERYLEVYEEVKR